jgi:transcriptional antiterminator NusG
MDKKISRVMVPTEEVIEIKEGKKRVATKKFFPGYVLVEMDLDENSLQFIKETPKVTGFLGGARPSPLSESEVEMLLHQIDVGTTQTRSKSQLEKGDNVRIIDGPFIGFNGIADDVNADQQKVKVLVSIFGRATPVELGFLQVERL